MPAKDFYKILDVSITASQDEIKKAYRQLALKYHPDVNTGGKATENWFREIHEAYRVLNDPDKRSAYNQDRWYRESTISGRMEPPATPEQMLLKAGKLATHTRGIDTDRTNFIALQQYILHLVSDENLAMLQQWNNTRLNEQIALEIISASDALNYARFLSAAEKLKCLAPSLEIQINETLRLKKKAAYWKSRQFPIILLIAVLLCLLIYFAAR